MKSTCNDFSELFKSATGNSPYPYQQRLATSESFPDIIEVPTGLGKTDAIILGWIWRRRFAERDIQAKTPRRLVFCLPMRVLVEQTRDKVENWLHNLNLSEKNSKSEENGISVTVLMGGEDKQPWDLFPERDAIIIGTQDMLISRALNRGYGMSRYRWPTHFGLLNNDCLWVMDEIQLMGKGLSTTIQLQAFRNKLGTIDSLPIQSIWMSATLKKDWLKTIDFDPQHEIHSVLTLGDDDLNVPPARNRINAVKILRKAENDSKNPKGLAKEIISRHTAGTRTLVVVNTVKRATDLFDKIEKEKPDAEIVLIHSRFRPPDRGGVVQALLEKPGESGTIIVSTQEIEAGVDVSAKILFTELAPWSSLVQRFGRCNRYGEYNDAEIFWIDVPMNNSAPYEEQYLSHSLEILTEYEGSSVGPANLPDKVEGFAHKQIIRRKEIFELFDTTPDLTGSDIDISRYIRESDSMDFSVFWRDIERSTKPDQDLPQRDELCSVPISDKDEVVKRFTAFIWDQINGEWNVISNSSEIYPGVSVMLDAKKGGYTSKKGWDVRSTEKVEVIPQENLRIERFYSDNSASVGRWESVAEHTDEVVREMGLILKEIDLDTNLSESLLDGARWHDAGKAHPSFQSMIKEEALVNFSSPPAAKAPSDAWKSDTTGKKTGDDGRRKYFRHELASGILALQNNMSDMSAYLAASHHGKVRGSIRSMPDEYVPPDKERRFARGVWDGDIVSKTDLGGGVTMPETQIDLSFMDLGEGTNGPSWAARVLTLRDSPEIGPFRLAYLEAVMKASDERASGGGKND